MKSKQTIFAICLTTCLIGSLSAQAAPTSQFGFKGWPYRQNSSCNTVSPTATACPTESIRPTATAYPTDSLTPAPSVCPTASALPTATACPTAIPTAGVETARPTATARPTEAPTVTKAPTATPAPTSMSPSTDDDYTTVGVTAQEEIAFKLLNQDRAANGRSALRLDAELCRLARLKSTDMKVNNYFAHTSPTYGSASDLLKANGYAFTSVGENIAHHATVEKAQAAFMSSSGHRTNILGSQWSKVGIGVAYDAQGYVYVTQLFVR